MPVTNPFKKRRESTMSLKESLAAVIDDDAAALLDKLTDSPDEKKVLQVFSAEDVATISAHDRESIKERMNEARRSVESWTKKESGMTAAEAQEYAESDQFKYNDDGTITLTKSFRPIDVVKKSFPPNVVLIEKSLVIRDMEFESLETLPRHIKGALLASNNKIKSFKGMPKVDANIDLSKNELVDFVGAPEEAFDDFNVSGNKIESLDGLPEKIGGDFNLSHNPITFDLNGGGAEFPDDFRPHWVILSPDQVPDSASARRTFTKYMAKRGIDITVV